MEKSHPAGRRDLTAPERIYQFTDERLQGDHARLRTVDATPNETIPHYVAAEGRLREAAILVGGRTKSHIEWVHQGARTETRFLDRIPPELAEAGRRIAEDMEIGDLRGLSDGPG